MILRNLGCVADDTEKAREAYRNLASKYSFVDMENDLENVEAIVVLGGDGFMLQSIHKYMKLDVPFYGMNCGTIGFLMNRYNDSNLFDRVASSHQVNLHPLRMFARTVDGVEHKKLAFNEVSLLRQTRLAAKIKVVVDHVTRIEEMICDGIMVATPAGSSAYNLSANGPIIPLSANIISLTPISVFRPRRWRGALLPHRSSIIFEMKEAEHRPVSVTADFVEIRDVCHIEVSEYRRSSVTLLFDPDEPLEERIVREQFVI